MLTKLNSCEGKQRFLSRQIAQTAARRKPRRSAYRCKFCNHYHVGVGIIPRRHKRAAP